MKGDEMTPERLDAILDGRAAPTDDEARDMLALAGALREAAPGAGDSLRARVRALPRPGPAGRLRSSGWRGRALIAAPALSVVVAAVVAIGVIARSPDGRSGGSDSSQAQRLGRAAVEAAPPTSATPSAASPGSSRDAAGAPSAPVAIQILPATLDARVADVRDLVDAASGTILEETRQPTTPPSVIVSITLPRDRSAEVLRAIVALGTGTGATAGASLDQAEGATGAAPGDLTLVRVVLTEAP